MWAAESPAPPLTGCSDTGGRGAEVADTGRITAPGGRNIYTANDDQVSINVYMFTCLQFTSIPRFHLELVVSRLLSTSRVPADVSLSPLLYFLSESWSQLRSTHISHKTVPPFI